MSAQDNVVALSRTGTRAGNDVLIHVRFHPSADIAAIDERPQHLSNFDWFKRLCEGAAQHYQTFAGGRGLFRIPRPTFEAIASKA
jgi:hypothetical protein